MAKEVEQLGNAGAVADLVRNEKKLGTIPKSSCNQKGRP